MSNRFPVTANVRITLTQVGADLRVHGWSKNEIKVGGDSPRVKVDQDGQNVSITAIGDCDISVPDHATLTIDSVGADAKITEVYGDLKIGSVGADLSLREVGNVELNAVGADVRVRQVKGDVKIGLIGADATLHEISGSVQIGTIGADAYLREVEGGCVVNRVGSDLVLDIDFKPNNEYSFMAASDIICRVAPGANVQFSITAEGIIVDAADARTEDLESGTEVQQVTLGTGAAHVKLVSNAEVRLINETDSRRIFGSGFDMNIDFDLERAFEETARATERARRDAERVSAQIQREAERTADQVRRKAERAAEQAQREMERMQRNGGRGFNFGWSWGSEKPKRGFGIPHMPTPPPPPNAPPAPTPPYGSNANRAPLSPDEPVTDNERLTILRMVESKQITVDEAERLLSALEGNV